MRTLFTKWLENLAQGKDLELIQYNRNTPKKSSIKTTPNQLKDKLLQAKLKKGDLKKCAKDAV